MATFDVKLLDDEDSIINVKSFNVTLDMIKDMTDIEALIFLKNYIMENITIDQKKHLICFKDVQIWDPSETPFGVGKAFMQQLRIYELAIKKTGEDLDSKEKQDKFYNNLENSEINSINNITEICSVCGKNLFGKALQEVLDIYNNEH